jgi:hypothetical protein
VKLLKAKYNLWGELVDTVFPTDASPKCKSIKNGLEPLKKGIIWRVKSGAKVKIWHDPWIPRPSSLRVCLKKGRFRLRWVSQLMKSNRRE